MKKNIYLSAKIVRVVRAPNVVLVRNNVPGGVVHAPLLLLCQGSAVPIFSPTMSYASG